LIVHEGQTYRLRVTRSGKLILHKRLAEAKDRRSGKRQEFGDGQNLERPSKSCGLSGLASAFGGRGTPIVEGGRFRAGSRSPRPRGSPERVPNRS
ncbi:MAG: hemin uptake protein HemP, partial [Planctomycetaceae bacterium]|nr:hemin uptake protein HemP [Planctomycetaceae bacterium]